MFQIITTSAYVYSKSFLYSAASSCLYNHRHTAWRVSDRYERLVTVVVQVLITSCCKYLSQVSVLDSSSRRAVKSSQMRFKELVQSLSNSDVTHMTSCLPITIRRLEEVCQSGEVARGIFNIGTRCI
jgi:hypothetical protein